MVFPEPEPILKDGQLIPHFNVKAPTDDMLQKYAGVRGLLNSCASSAEDINMELKRICSALNSPDKNSVENLELKDFMFLKNSFVHYIKDSPDFTHLAPKPLRKSLDWFIIYRNIFIHGKLLIQTPGNNFYIEYVGNHSKKTEYMLVTDAVLSSFYETYAEFKKLTKSFQDIQNSKKD